jgi:hypothetical protein
VTPELKYLSVFNITESASKQHQVIVSVSAQVMKTWPGGWVTSGRCH